MDDPDVIKAAFEESGLDAEKLMAQMQDAGEAKLISNTEAAAEREYSVFLLFLLVTKCLKDIIYGKLGRN